MSRSRCRKRQKSRKKSYAAYMSLRSMPIIRGPHSGPTVSLSILFHGKQLNWKMYFTKITTYNDTVTHYRSCMQQSQYKAYRDDIHSRNLYQKLTPNRTQLYLVQVSGTKYSRPITAHNFGHVHQYKFLIKVPRHLL